MDWVDGLMGERTFVILELECWIDGLEEVDFYFIRSSVEYSGWVVEDMLLVLE